MGDGPRVQIPVDKKVSTPNLGVSSESYELLFCLYPVCISFPQLVIRLMICLSLEHCRNALLCQNQAEGSEEQGSQFSSNGRFVCS